VPRILRGLPSPASDVLVDLGRIALAEGGSFTGFVTDEEGKPLAGVSVWIAAGESPPSRALAFRLMHSRPAAVTGPTGIFELRDLASEESVQLWVARDGYVPVWRRGDLGQGEREPILIVLSPGLTVSGWVLDEDGKPVARAQVSLRDADHPIESADRGLGPGNLAETSTGAVGEFQIGDLEPGTVVVSVTAENYLPTEPQVLNLYQERTVKDLTFVLKRGSVLYGRVSHNGAPVAAAFVEVGKTVTRSLADGSYRLSGLSSGLALVNVRHPSYRPLRREIEIAPGSTNLDFTLETGLRLRGRVVFQEAGRPAEGANLRLVVQGYSEAKAYAKTAADGSFAMDGLIEGRYSLTAEKQGYFAPPILVDLMEDAEVEIELQLAGSIKGRILGLKDADLARVRVEAAQRRQAARSGVVWSSGEFAVEGLEPGAWTLRAWLPGGTRQTVATVDIATEDRQVHRDLEFVGLSLAGRVTYGGAPLIGATISLTGLTDLIQRAITTDDRGEFRIEDLPRNRYLFSLNERRQMVFYSREIQVDDDQRLDVEIPAAGLSGRVVSDSTGGPVTGVLVQLTPLVRVGNALATSLASVMTDANGLFAFPRLAAGSYHLIVQGPGFRPLDRTLELIAGKHEEGLVLALTPTGN